MLDREKRLEPGKLWSLWDVLELKAEAYSRSLEILVILHAYSNKNMTFDHDGFAQFVKAKLGELRLQLETLEADVTIKALDHLIENIKDGTPFTQIAANVLEVRSRLLDELGSTFILSLNKHERRLFEPGEPLFGEIVAKQFRSLTHDIAEAGKCLALGRSTAAAFHAIRCLECGIRAMSRCLGVPDPTKGRQRNWGVALGAIKGAIDQKWPPGVARFSGDGQMFERFHGHLAAMQNPYRNEAMHLDAKYTEQEAQDIFLLVKGILVSVASRMDENGEPKA